MLVTEKLLYEERKPNKKENRVFYACERHAFAGKNDVCMQETFDENGVLYKGFCDRCSTVTMLFFNYFCIKQEQG